MSAPTFTTAETAELAAGDPVCVVRWGRCTFVRYEADRRVCHVKVAGWGAAVVYAADVVLWDPSTDRAVSS